VREGERWAARAIDSKCRIKIWLAAFARILSVVWPVKLRHVDLSVVSSSLSALVIHSSFLAHKSGGSRHKVTSSSISEF